MNRRGFSLVELMTTVAILGVLASIAMPKYQSIGKRATAAEVVSAMTAVRAAAYQYSETVGAWPPTAGLGEVPPGLEPYLNGAGGNLFKTEQYQLGWLAMGLQGVKSNSSQMVYAFLEDGVICQALYGLWGGAKNQDVLGLCTAQGGVVFLWVDR